MKVTLADLPTEPLGPLVTRQRLSGQRLELVLYTYRPGATFAVHQHEAEQLTIVLEGRLIFVFDDGEVALGPGEALLIDSGRPHGAYVPATAGLTRTYNLFSPVRAVLPDA